MQHQSIRECIALDHRSFDGSTAGKCIKTLKGYYAFIPNPLPPKIHYDNKLIRQLSEADRLLGELSGTARLLPNPYLLISPYVRREAVSSSRIEGTQASLGDLFFYEAEGDKESKTSDVREVHNYVTALEHGLRRLKSLPVSVRLLREIHEILMQKVRGEYATPGELRRSQNWIGPLGSALEQAVFIPPPPEVMPSALTDWENYYHSGSEEPPLVKCALLHYQFEAIHPFLDGNGRIGRLIIVFFLKERQYLTQPLLYLSSFFEKQRSEYYSKLLSVSQKGDWRGWIEFFLQGITTQSSHALADAKRILELNKSYKMQLEGSKKVPESAHRLIDETFSNPVISISRLCDKWNLPFNSVKNGVNRLVELKILRLATTHRKRNKLYVADKLMKLLTRT